MISKYPVMAATMPLAKTEFDKGLLLNFKVLKVCIIDEHLVH